MTAPDIHDHRRALETEGEMAGLVETFDWSATPLGPREAWPTSLRTLVHLVLAARFPMVLLWGPELVTLYNDAFRPILSVGGKHPRILGRPGRESWAESWGTVGAALLDVLHGGPSMFKENQYVPLDRGDGMDYGYFTHSYSPVLDDSGAIGGVLVTVVETTQDVEHMEYFSGLTIQP